MRKQGIWSGESEIDVLEKEIEKLKVEVKHSKNECKILFFKSQNLAQRLEDSLKNNDKVLEFLKRLTKTSFYADGCVGCGMTRLGKYRKHSADCKLQAMITRLEGE